VSVCAKGVTLGGLSRDRGSRVRAIVVSARLGVGVGVGVGVGRGGEGGGEGVSIHVSLMRKAEAARG
jgi:hypothetical protein